MPENPTPEAPETPKTPDGATPPEQPLGEPGLAALKAERDAKEAAEKSARALAKRVQELEEKDKSEQEKQQAAVERTRKELEELTAEKNRAVVAADKGIPVTLLAGPASTSPEDVAAFADALIQFRTDQAPRLHVAGEGKSPDKSTTTDSAFVKGLFSGD